MLAFPSKLMWVMAKSLYTPMYAVEFIEMRYFFAWYSMQLGALSWNWRLEFPPKKLLIFYAVGCIVTMQVRLYLWFQYIIQLVHNWIYLIFSGFISDLQQCYRIAYYALNLGLRKRIWLWIHTAMSCSEEQRKDLGLAVGGHMGR
jgi:hypothetical protein